MYFICLYIYTCIYLYLSACLYMHTYIHIYNYLYAYVNMHSKGSEVIFPESVFSFTRGVPGSNAGCQV